MKSLVLAAILIGIVLIAGVSKRIKGTLITLPMLYTLLGLFIGWFFPDLIGLSYEDPLVEAIVTLTLMFMLASDASRMRLAEIKKHHSLPWRLLLIAVPLTVAFGTGAGVILFGGLSVWVVAVLAVSLTPTDDGVAEYAVDNPGVPVRIRQGLNIEGGLEDGILLPLLLALIALATSGQLAIGEGAIFSFTMGHLVFGILVGVGMGYVGARYIDLGLESGWMSSDFQKICWLLLVLLTYGVAEQIGGNGLIAAFAFGITAGNTLVQQERRSLYDFSSTENTLLMLVTYILLGMVLLPPALRQLDVTMVVYALLSLTVVRMLAVAISMIGAKLQPESVLFLGWFGPRGIPSILYIYTILGVDEMAGRDRILYTAMVTVFFSIVLHGVSAAPLSSWYARRIATYDTADLAGAEKKSAPELPTRTGNVPAAYVPSEPAGVPR